MTEFFALKAKYYAFSFNGEGEIIAKGIRGNVVKHHMTLADRVKCLNDEPGFNCNKNNVSFQSFKHNLVALLSNKLTFNNNDDKYMVLKDGIHTLAHEHYRI